MTFTFVKLRVCLAFVGLILLPRASFVTLAQSPAIGNDRVAWVLFVDDLHLDFRNTGRVIDLLRTVLNDVVREEDLAAIRTSGPSTVLTDFSNRWQLLPLVRKLSGGGLKRTEILTIGKPAGPNELNNPNEMSNRTRLALSSATAAVALLGEVESSRRAMLYISNGHPFDMDGFIETRALAGLARQDDVKIFAIDAASLDPASSAPATSDPAWEAHTAAARHSLSLLAERTGGFAILEVADIPAALQRISNSIRQ